MVSSKGKSLEVQLDNLYDTDGIIAVTKIQGTFNLVTKLNTGSEKIFRLYNATFASFPNADDLSIGILILVQVLMISEQYHLLFLTHINLKNVMDKRSQIRRIIKIYTLTS